MSDGASRDDVVRAIDLALGGAWDEAHEIVQRHESDVAGRWIHAVLHKIEGDLANKRDEYGNRLPFPAEQLSRPGRYERHVYVYIPKQVKPGAPFMVVQDGHSYINRMAPVLDNMIAAGRLPAMIIVAPDSGGSDAQGSQRGLDPEKTWHNWPLANNRMAEVLKKKGYDYRYVFAMDARHVDNGVVRQTLPQALEWLWRDYPKS